jgi:hypothetical protein
MSSILKLVKPISYNPLVVSRKAERTSALYTKNHQLGLLYIAQTRRYYIMIAPDQVEAPGLAPDVLEGLLNWSRCINIALDFEVFITRISC